MATLSERLADLSVRVGDLEARAEALRSEKTANRDHKVGEMRRAVAAGRSKLTEPLRATGDEISTAWLQFDQSMRDRVEAIRAQILAKKDAVDADCAASRADRLERNAGLAIEFAVIAAAEAELAVADAIDARRHAERLAATGTL